MKYTQENDNELLFMIEESNEESLKTLVDKYKYIVNAIVKKYLPRIEYSGLEEKDLVQEGLIGLIQAVKTFDKNKDVLFYTYATVCVESRIKSSLRTEGRQKNKYLNSSVSLDMIFNEEFNLYSVLIDEEEDPGRKIMRKEEHEEIINNLKSKLTKFENSVFDLKLSGLSNTEIALILDKEKRSIENTLSRIKQKYKEIKNKVLV